MSKKVILELNCLEQAYVLRDALDLYCRLGLGQLEQIEELFRREDIPTAKPVSFDDRLTLAECLSTHMATTKKMLGFQSNASHGIGSAAVPLGARRAYELQKVLSKALAEHQEPAPAFRGVNYDGVILRYTQDPLPAVVITGKADT